jgi:hypothetical protein
MKNILRPRWDQQQCPLQRGFTKHSAPLNAAFILEEARREALDIGNLLNIVLLDAKSAFDVVVHKNLLKKLYHLGIQDKHWTLIKSLHTNASSAIKFNGLVSENFNILQGVRQGGILSADLYKIYINPLLKQLQQSRLGMDIGYIECGATACADDIPLNCTDLTEAQIMLNMAYNYSCNEQYKLQLQKSMVIQMESKKKSRHNPIELKFKDTILPNVETATHLGMQRSKTDKETIENTVNENIKKARRTAHCLMAA